MMTDKEATAKVKAILSDFGMGYMSIKSNIVVYNDGRPPVVLSVIKLPWKAVYSQDKIKAAQAAAAEQGIKLQLRMMA